MRPDALRLFLQKRPFFPFRVYVSDGASYYVPHPEAAEVAGMTLLIQVGPTGFAGPPGERLATISLIHVTRIEVFYPGAAPAP